MAEPRSHKPSKTAPACAPTASAAILQLHLDPSSVDSDHSGIRPPTHGPASILEPSNFLAHPQAADADRARKVCNPMTRPAEAAAGALIGSHRDFLLHPVIPGDGNGLSVKGKEARPLREPRELGVVAVKVCDEADDHGM
ncbi:hypothetical protein V2G26_017241 [Clonostachys chloroleuca]